MAVQALALPGIRDSQCGFKLFTARAAEVIFPQQRLEQFSFDVELLWIARQAGLRIAEVPVTWRNHPLSKVHPLRDSAGMLRDLMRIRLNASRARYASIPGRGDANHAS